MTNSMNSKYSNQDLINATLEIYNEFKPNSVRDKFKKNKANIIKKPEPLLLSKEVNKKQKKSKEIKKESKRKIEHFLNNKSSLNKKISNQQRLKSYKKKRDRQKYKKTLKLNKIIKFENDKYLLLDKIKNSELKIIKMKRPVL